MHRTIPGKSQNDDFENRQPTGERSQNDPYPNVEFSVRQASNLADSDQEETLTVSQNNLVFVCSIPLSLKGGITTFFLPSADC